MQDWCMEDLPSIHAVTSNLQLGVSPFAGSDLTVWIEGRVTGLSSQAFTVE